MRHEFIPTPYRKLVTLRAGEFPPDLYLPPGTIVRLQVPAAWGGNLGELRAGLEAAGMAEVRVEVERAESVRRREVAITAQSDLPTALDGYLVQKLDYQPMRDELLGVAQEVVAETGGGM